MSPLTYEDGYRHVTYRDLASVINGLAWLLQNNFGIPVDNSIAELVPYLVSPEMIDFCQTTLSGTIDPNTPYREDLLKAARNHYTSVI